VPARGPLEGRSNPAEQAQGLGWAIGSRQGDHETSGRPFAARVVRDDRREHLHRTGGFAERELGIGEHLDALLAKLLQACGLVAGERLLDARVRRTAPQRERLAQQACGPRGGGDHQWSCLGHQRFELRRVEGDPWCHGIPTTV
jgi:hypothetical protein